ncbi:MAG: tRNA (adenosine(37)-N6)-threonylcarbamoyltransferase complex dimerization subunit type 1 TsaB [Verrucomicrobia bacterium]|nr:tRNA (adenosine(37)-N6)-threonylcarbamoyltransferase complex dimerization subunit type 1 TsaB [Verrucomicrobiota bacterium]
MIILALEFSSDRHSVAIARCAMGKPPVVLGEAHEQGARHIHSLALVASALTAAHVEREAVECIAIGLGPGSLTGIRSAIALAQGWQLAHGVSVQGVSSVECLAAQAHEAGLRGVIHAVLDAQRGDFYAAGYEIDDTGWRATYPLRLMSANEAGSMVGSAVCVGPGAGRLGAKGRPMFPDASALARLAGGRNVLSTIEQLEPINLRQVSFVKAAAPRKLPATGNLRSPLPRAAD